MRLETDDRVGDSDREVGTQNWASLQLVTRMEVLGDPKPMAVHDGYVHLGFWDLSLLGTDERSSTVFYLVRVPLTLDFELGHRLVRRVTLEIVIESSGARAHDLFPDEVLEKAELTFFVAGDYRFDRRAGERSVRKLDLKVEPEIKGWGRGNRIIRWIFSTRGNAGIASGDRELYYVLAAPSTLGQLEVEVKADIDIGREILGMWYENSTDLVSQKLEIELHESAAKKALGVQRVDLIGQAFALAGEADELRIAKNPAMAIDLYRGAIALLGQEMEKARLATAYYGLGLCLRTMGRTVEADQAFRAVLELPEAEESIRLLARIALH